MPIGGLGLVAARGGDLFDLA